ncbi:Ig-like domain-containing protein, partial [Arundinibacter roseus]
TYTPDPGFVGEDVFCYAASDGIASDTACVAVTVQPNPTPANDSPLALNDNTQTTEGTPLSVNVLANDVDPDGDALQNPTVVQAPANGTASVNADGTILYTPDPGFVGTDTLTYRVCDTGTPSLCDSAQVIVQVLPAPVDPAANQAPIAVDDANTTTVNTPVTGTVAANDSDPDGDALTFAGLTNPANGTLTVNADGSYVYTPAADFIGSDVFTYTVCDNGTPSLCDTATVFITVTPVAGKVALLPKVYLQGALFGVFLPDTLMRDDLRLKNLIPTTSPYPDMGLIGITSANVANITVVNASTTSTNNSIVDWVFVELRSALDSTLVLDSRSALVQRDGDIVEVDGLSAITFDSAVPGSYYVVVRHRNHLGVMSASPIALSTATTVVDFRKAATPTFNLNAASAVNIPQVPVQQGVALWAGNALYLNTLDSMREVIFQGPDNDVNVIYQQVINSPANALFKSPFFNLKGYYNGDINMNGETIFQGTGNDVEFIYQNVQKNHEGNTLKQPFFKIKEQTP